MTGRRLSKAVREVRRKGRSGGPHTAHTAGRDRYVSESGPEMRQPGYSSKRDELPLEPVHPVHPVQAGRSESRYPDYQEREREQPGQKGFNDRSSQYSWEPLPRSSRAGERYSYRR